MSTRERWTIYPLLFLALGAALRSRITSTFDVGTLTSHQMETSLVKATEVICEDLLIADKDGKRRVRLGTTRQNAGAMELYGRDGKTVAALTVDPVTNRASLVLQSADGAPYVMIHSDDTGGVVETLSSAGLPQVVIHSTARGGLVSAVDAAGTVVIELGHRTGESGVFNHDDHGVTRQLLPQPQSAPVSSPVEP